MKKYYAVIDTNVIVSAVNVNEKVYHSLPN